MILKWLALSIVLDVVSCTEKILHFSCFSEVFRVFLGVFLVFLGFSEFSWGVPGFIGSVPGFWEVFLVFRVFRNVP